MTRGFPSQDTGPGMGELFHDLQTEQAEERSIHPAKNYIAKGNAPSRKTTMNDVNPITHPELDTSPFPCIVCARPFSNVVSTQSCPNQPYEGATFNSHGQYGCTVFDEIDGSKLEINICDDCLKAARDRGYVGYWPGHPKRKLSKWTEE